MGLSQRSIMPIASVIEPASSDAWDGDAQFALISFIPELLEELQCDLLAILEEIGIERAQFNDPKATIPFSKIYRLLDACAKASASPHFGLLMGQRFSLSQLGLVEQLMHHSNTVHAALLQFIRHLHINDRGAVVYLIERNDGDVALGYSVFTQKLPGLTELFDYAMLNAVKIMKQLCGSAWQPIRVTFAHHKPQNLQMYQQAFQTTLLFNSARTEIIFSKRWLSKPIKTADYTKRIITERTAINLESENHELFVHIVRRTIQTLQLTGDASAAAVCKKLGTHERILRRRLQKEGTSIKRLKNEIRLNLACQLLGITKLTLSEIANVLGYSDKTAFSRAFRNQTNITPINWRLIAAASFGIAKVENA